MPNERHDTDFSISMRANIFFVTDLERAKKWYADVFGMEVVEYRPPEFLEMKLGEAIFYIETYNEKRAEGFKDTHIGGRMSAIFAVRHLKGVIETRRGMGVHIVVEPVQQFWGGWNAIIADPDGNEFVLDDDE